MRITPVQNSFTSGEISPRLQARFDLDAYYTGAAKLLNFVCLPHGPLLRRQGTTFIAEAGSADVRLIPFKFSAKQSLIIELGEKYARFFFRGGQITNTDGTPYQIATPWSAEQIHEIDFAQSGDTVYIVHPEIAPQKMVRTANDNWTIAAVSFKDKPAKWSDGNWPSRLVFHEQRLYYANTPKYPQTVWASRVGLYDEFTMKDTSGEVLDDMAIEYTIASDEVNGIQWLKAVDSLTCGTSGAEYRIMAGSSTEAISPTNIRIIRQTSYGSMEAKVQQLGNGVVFAQRGGTRVRIFEYGYTEDQYTAQDLTIMSEHIFAGRIKELDLQTVQDPYIWFVLKNGDFVGLTYEKAQKITAWHRHALGGNGKAKSLAIIPGDDSDEVWLAVERIVNGQTKVYIEVFIDAFSEVDSPDQGYFVDSHLSYEGDEAISRVGGLEHLEGYEVSVCIDGWVHPNVTVTDGYIDLQSAGYKIVVGLPYESYFESVPVQSSDQIIMGNLKRIYGASISVLQSLGMTIGVIGAPDQSIYMGPTVGLVNYVDSDVLDQMIEGDSRVVGQTVYMGPTPIMNKATPLFTGTLSVKAPASTDNEMQLFIKHDMPLPCEIRAIKYELEVNQ